MIVTAGELEDLEKLKKVQAEAEADDAEVGLDEL